jgi:signal transduction histidine kinase
VSAHKIRWISFLGGGLVLALALAWVTWAAVTLEREQFEERVESLELEFQNRALGRLDAAVTTLLARENQRPPLHWFSFFEPDKAFSLAGFAVEPHDYYQPSPLLSPDNEYARLYFSVAPDGSFSSPQVPPDEPGGEFRNLALDQQFVERPALARAERDLTSLARRVDLTTLLRVTKRAEGMQPPEPGEAVIEPLVLKELLLDPAHRTERARAELLWRNMLVRWAVGGAHVQAFTPHLIQGEEKGSIELIFLRAVPIGDAKAIQGIWLDWPSLKVALLRTIREIYPTADLKPTRGLETARLVTIPFTLEARTRTPFTLPALTPTRLALIGLWVAFLAAGVAAGLTLQKTMELSERRRSFVSAVTHELRTPLTTFCMYSEMLADGIVRDPAAQQEYFTTLKDESIRLRRIVENVLEYARLEGRRAGGKYAPIGVEELLDRVLPALERRAAEAGMELEPDLRARPDAVVEVEVQAIEQILFNLVDNAAKYGTGGEPRIHLEAITTRDELVVTVVDHGPGIPGEVRRAVFAPFKRAAGDAEGIIPGIGLGLSLSRGMARNLGGDVRVEDREGYGAVFSLTLPRR